MQTLQNPALVFFDLETTGLSTVDCAIVQIGAVNWDASKTFDEFLTPNRNFDTGAAHVTGLSIETPGFVGRLMNGDGRRIHTRSPAEGLTLFRDWLIDISRFGVILVAFNGHKFDAKVLWREFRRCGIDPGIITAIIDPFVYLKNINSPHAGKGQQDLMDSLNVARLPGAHNAIVDAENLRRIFHELVETQPGLMRTDSPRTNHFLPFSRCQ